MSERTSAGELQQRGEIKHLMLDFYDEMKWAMQENIPQKGMSWRDNDVCTTDYLKRKLRQAVKCGAWVAVANYAFMLNDREHFGR